MSEATINAAIDALVAAFEREVAALRQEVADTFAEPEPTPPELPVIELFPGDDLQAALDALAPTGGTMRLVPGAYTCNLVLRPRSSTVPIQITTSGALPAGRPESAEGLPLLRARDPYTAVLRAQPGASGLACVGLAFGPQAPDRTVVELGADQHGLTRLEDVPHHFGFRQCYFAGDPIAGQHRAIACNAADVVIAQCTFRDYHEAGRDSQAICGWNGTARLTIADCWIEAGAENVLFGGADAASADLMPRDVTIRGCTFTKNPAWKTLPKVPAIKCLFEVKALIGLSVSGCVFEKNWARDWPTGVAVVIKCANQEGGAPWSVFEDVVIEDCVIRDVGAPFQVVGQNDGSAGHVTERGAGLTIRNVLAYNINKGEYLGTGKGFEVLNAPDDWTIDHLTMIGANNCIMTASYAKEVTTKATGFRFTNSVTYQGAYGLHSPAGLGTVMLDATFADWQFEAVAIRKDPARKITFPPGNAVLEQTAFDASLDQAYVVLPGSAIATAVVTTDGALPGVEPAVPTR